MKTTTTATTATAATTQAPRTNAASNCSWVGNGYNYKMVREWHLGTRPKQNDSGMARQQGDDEMGGSKGEEVNQTGKGPRDISDVS